MQASEDIKEIVGRWEVLLLPILCCILALASAVLAVQFFRRILEIFCKPKIDSNTPKPNTKRNKKVALGIARVSLEQYETNMRQTTYSEVQKLMESKEFE